MCGLQRLYWKEDRLKDNQWGNYIVKISTISPKKIEGNDKDRKPMKFEKYSGDSTKPKIGLLKNKIFQKIGHES